jgi:hypothetical protein
MLIVMGIFGDSSMIHPTQPMLKHCSAETQAHSENKLDINSLTKIYKSTHFRLCPGYLAGEFDGVVAD